MFTVFVFGALTQNAVKNLHMLQKEQEVPGGDRSLNKMALHIVLRSLFLRDHGDTNGA